MKPTQTPAREALAQLARRSAERATNTAPATAPTVTFGIEMSSTQMLVARFSGRKVGR